MHSFRHNTLISAAIAVLAVQSAGASAFTMPSEGLRSTFPERGRSVRRPRPPMPHVLLPHHEVPTSGSRLLAVASDEDDDDDGWGASPSKGDQERELAALQAERVERSAPTPSNSNSRAQEGEPPERDLFIPIFALISLAGLFGSYGYEMLRLYSRGELYLPWDQ